VASAITLSIDCGDDDEAEVDVFVIKVGRAVVAGIKQRFDKKDTELLSAFKALDPVYYPDTFTVDSKKELFVKEMKVLVGHFVGNPPKKPSGIFDLRTKEELKQLLAEFGRVSWWGRGLCMHGFSTVINVCMRQGCIDVQLVTEGSMTKHTVNDRPSGLPYDVCAFGMVFCHKLECIRWQQAGCAAPSASLWHLALCRGITLTFGLMCCVAVSCCCSVVSGQGRHHPDAHAAPWRPHR
jgi:hypothetical protein